MNKGILPLILLCMSCQILLFSFSSCGRSHDDSGTNPAVIQGAGDSSGEKGPGGALSFDNVQGNWKIIYGGNYGYDFWFYRNYQSMVTLYLGDQALLFKGTYLVDGNGITINILESKNENNVSNMDYSHGFLQRKASLFVFRAEISEKSGKKILVLSPQQIKIDGNDSSGLFEPQIKLKYQGR